jgi:hypothetical protein
MRRVILFKMTTFTNQGERFSYGEYKTRSAMRKAKERYNVSYGAHLRSEVIEVLEDGSEQRGVCLA